MVLSFGQIRSGHGNAEDIRGMMFHKRIQSHDKGWLFQLVGQPTTQASNLVAHMIYQGHFGGIRVLYLSGT